MANKKITDLQLIAAVTDSINVPGDDGIQTYRLTIAQIKAWILASGNVGTTALANLAVTAAKIAAGAVTDDKTSFTQPTFSSVNGGAHTGGFSANGSGTYTTPANVKRLRVTQKAGGGGGGSGGTTIATQAGAGGNTTFGSNTANGGTGGLSILASGAPAGGSGSFASGIVGEIVTGCSGQTGSCGTTGSLAVGGSGGGHGAGVGIGSSNNGGAALTNSGAGGGGGGGAPTTSVGAGNGGAEGGKLIYWIETPATTYSYAVGTGGAGSTAGASGGAGGNGAGGYIFIEEFYQ